MKTRSALAAVVGVALVSLYARSFLLLASQGYLASAGAFQIGMILLQTLKLVIILSWKRLRNGSMIMIFDIFSIELLILPILVVAALLTGGASISSFEYGVFTTWPLSLALVFVPYVAYRVVRAMLSDELPSLVIPGAVLVMGLTVFSSQALSTSTGVASTDFTRALVHGFISSAGAISPLSLDPVTAVALPALFLALVVYAAIGRTQSGGSLIPSLLVALFSSLLVLGWTADVASMPGAVLLFAVPTLGLLAAIRWSGRGA